MDGAQPYASTVFNASTRADKMVKRLTPRRSIAILIGGLFISEMVSMGLIGLLHSLSYFRLIILDVTLSILFTTPLLYFFALRPLIQALSEREVQIAQRLETESQLRLQTTALDSAANGVFITDRRGEILWANQAFFRMTGYSITELLGKTPKLLNSGRQGLDFFKEMWDAILSGSVWQGEIINRRKDGSLYIIEQSITPVINSSGEIENFIAIQKDVTEHKQAENALRESEEKFRTLVDWTYDWEKWIDPQGAIVYCSPSCERITGYRPEEFIADPDLRKRIVHPEDLKSYDEHHLCIHNEAEGIKNIEYRIIARDGSEHWIDHICRPVFGHDKRYLGRRISCRDITERKLAQKEIEARYLNEKLLTQTIHTMQIDIARDLHDTIGQNVSLLRMKLDYLFHFREQAMPPHMTAEIKHMSAVADDLYDQMRAMLVVLQSGSSADPVPLLSRYAEKIAERSGLKIVITCQGSSKSLPSGIVRQILYIFREALNNIEKHANASEAKVDFTWEDGKLTLAISDNGRGFNPNLVEKDSHYGLKFMRERVEHIKGSLSIQSATGNGTKIVVNVPL